MGATIFNAAFVKSLKANFKFLENVYLITDQAADPSVSAYSAPIGSLYFRYGTNKIYKKQDSGSSTNWSKMGSLAETLAYSGSIISDPTGFVNETETTISVVNGTRTFTLAKTGVNFTVYQKGIPYIFNSDQSIVFPDTEGVHHFFFDLGILSVVSAFDVSLITSKVYIANIYWDATNKKAVILGNERHGMMMDGATHLYLHQTLGAKFVAGMGLGDFIIDANGSLNTHAQFSASLGNFRDEDIDNHVSAVGVGVANIPMLYLEGASSFWRSSAPNGYPVRTAGTGRAAYNQFTGGAWQQTEVSNGNFTLTHVFATNDRLYSGFVFVQGQTEYTTIALARVGANSEINSLTLGTLPFAEFIPVGTVIYETKNTYTNAVKSILRSSETGGNYYDWRIQQPALGTPATDHGLLSGLQDDDHYSLYKRIDNPSAVTGTVAIDSTVTRNQFYLADTSGGNVTFNLGALASFPNGFEATIKKSSGLNSVIIDPNGAELIDGVGLLVLSDLNDQVTIIKNTTQWEARGRTPQNPSGLISGSNYNAKNSIGNWLTYFDAAGVSPLDMIGGVPTNTITRNTTNPISGVSDFLYSKGAGSKQGEGFALTLVNIPNKYKSRGCIFRFKYLTDANYVDSQVGIFVYDITGAAVYQLNPVYLKKSGLIESSFAEIQLPNTLTSGFRIGFHVIGTDTTAYTIQFTEFTFDEKVTSQNSSITDWQAFTLASSWSGFVSLVSSVYRRNGDQLEVSGQIKLNSAPTGNFFVDLPFGLQFDPTKALTAAPSTPSFGPAISYDNSLAAYYNGGVTYYTANQVCIVGATGNFVWSAGTPFTWAANDIISFSFSVPILGWSAGTQVADIYTGRNVTAKVYKASNVPIGTLTNNKILFDSTTFDTVAGFDSVNSRYIAKTSGYYRANTSLFVSNISPSAAGTFLGNALYKNGAKISHGNSLSFENTTANQYGTMTTNDIVYLNVGDYLELVFANYSGGNVTVNGGDVYSFMSIEKIQSPNQPLASEKVIESYTSTSGANIPATDTIYVFPTKVEATHGWYNNSTGVLSIGRSGILNAKAQIISVLNNIPATNTINISIRKNGINIKTKAVAGVGESSYFNPSVEHSFSVNAGDTVDIVTSNATGSPIATIASAVFCNVQFTMEL